MKPTMTHILSQSGRNKKIGWIRIKKSYVEKFCTASQGVHLRVDLKQCLGQSDPTQRNVYYRNIDQWDGICPVVAGSPTFSYRGLRIVTLACPRHVVSGFKLVPSHNLLLSSSYHDMSIPNTPTSAL